MNIEEIKETILEMNDYGTYEDTGMIINNFIDNQQQKISNYEKIINNLKCCANCKNYNDKYGYDCCNDSLRDFRYG